MDTREQTMMSKEGNYQSNSKERKIYPITGEMIDEEERLMPIEGRKYLEMIRRGEEPDWMK